MRLKKILLYNLVSLFLLYLNIVFFFSLIYFLLDYHQLGPIVDHYSSSLHQNHTLDRFTRSFYFSAITLFSVGYGDITPFGWSRAVAILEASIGYILPAVLVIRYILVPPRSFAKVWLRSEKHKRERN